MSQLKEAFEVESKYGTFYTGGHVEWHDTHLYLYTPTYVSQFDISTGTVSAKLAEEQEDNPDTIQTFTKNDDKLVTAHRSGLLKLWNAEGELVKVWKSIHKGPIAKLTLNGKMLASAGADAVIRLWDLEFNTCRLALKGCQGVINVSEFHPSENELLASGDDGKINLFNLQKGNLVRVYTGHFSKVTSIAFHCDNRHFISSGRDKVIILWSFDSQTALKTIPVAETIESVVSLPLKFKIPNFNSKNSEGVYVASAGDRGTIRIWNVTDCKEIYVQQNSLVNKSAEEGGLAITKLIYNGPSKCFAVITADQNVIVHDLKTFDCVKQFVGFSDEILDATYLGENDSHLAVATNSIDIKLYEYSTMNCQLLKGHTDLVLCLSRSPSDCNLMVSSAKDNSVKVWSLKGDVTTCIGTGTRHTGSVDAVVLSSSFIVSGSQDTCIKLWKIPDGTETVLTCLHTKIAHDKGINSVAVAPNDKFIASASQDKTIKLWDDELRLLGSLRGHRRGVWSVKFSPVDQVLMSTSADCTVKLWSITEFYCLKTFEGHDSSVLRGEFLSRGAQILTAGADGLIKLFNIRTSETVATYGEHDGKVWTLAVRGDESQFVSGGSDSTLLKWRDVTEDRRAERLKQQEELAVQEQQLRNYLQDDQLLKALKLALKLDKPLNVLKIVQRIIKKGEAGLNETIAELADYQKEQLLRVASDWNTNSRYCQPAQLVLNVLLNELQTGEFRPVGLSSIVEGTLPYTERHLKRLTQLMQDLHFLDYTINCIQPHAKGSF